MKKKRYKLSKNQKVMLALLGWERYKGIASCRDYWNGTRVECLRDGHYIKVERKDEPDSPWVIVLCGNCVKRLLVKGQL